MFDWTFEAARINQMNNTKTFNSNNHVTNKIWIFGGTIEISKRLNPRCPSMVGDVMCSRQTLKWDDRSFNGSERKIKK